MFSVGSAVGKYAVIQFSPNIPLNYYRQYCPQLFTMPSISFTGQSHQSGGLCGVLLPQEHR